jgi:hypothetical protein
MSAEKSESSYSGSAKSTADSDCSSISGIDPVIRGDIGSSLDRLNRASWVAARITEGIGVTGRDTGADKGDSGDSDDCRAAGCAFGPRNEIASASVGMNSRILRNTSPAWSFCLFST